MNRRCPQRALSCLLLLSLVLGATTAAAASRKDIRALQKLLSEDRAREGMVDLADLHVVDCLLPGQVRRLGQQTYLGPRRPVKTAAADCRLRGGEYVAYDRADYASALRVWMAAAEAGDANAQTNVGEIFEKGLGTTPNYEAALIWYRKAAAQGDTRAQFNLGTLYEQGLGVPQDPLTALNWYRQAWGLAQDDVIFASAAQREREAQARRLMAQLRERDREIEALEAQLERLRQTLGETSAENAAAQAQVTTLGTLLARLRKEQQAQQLQLDGLPVQIREQVATAPLPGKEGGDDLALREPRRSEEARLRRPAATPRSYRKLKLGNYYALLIGNAEYERMEALSTPLNDVARAQQILEDKYGFTVLTLRDGDNVALMQAINDLSEILTEDDNLLLFFAGHGSRLNIGGAESGYWLPRNAERPPRNTYWVPNEFITGHLSRLQARRVLVVADSCYAGLLSGEPSMLLLGDDAPQYSNLEFLEFKLKKRARLLLASGGDRPVLDTGGDGHSVFARAFLDELERNDRLLASPELFLNIRERVAAGARAAGFDQRPELKSIKAAGHEVGDFFFVPRS
ncbi:MAG: caspase family protein [Pseudomonadota bacterium]